MGKRDMKNKTPPSGAKSQSLVLRLNTRLFFRQLGIFLCMDLLLVVLALMGQLMWAEKRCADVAQLVQERGVPTAEAVPWMAASDYTIIPLDREPKGVDVGELGWFSGGEATADGLRTYVLFSYYTVELPNGQSIDFGHLLAAMNLVYRGMPITGSWGGDCMQLAQVYAGQASDADGYASLMQQTFAIEDDGSASKFGDQDLRADLDSVVAGAELKSGSNVADVLRNYYTNLTDYDRCYQFIAMSFGSMNTSDSEAFRNKVYSTMTADAGMQLLLYMNGMWSSSGWQVDADAEPALRGACNELADYLSRAVNGEKVKSASSTLMHTMAGQALVDALNALGDGEAASAAQSALEADSGATISTSSGDAVDDALNTATEKLKTDFNAQAFELGLLVLGAAALLGMVVCIAMLISHRSKRNR